MKKKELIMERLELLKRLTKELAIELPAKKTLRLFEIAQITNANGGTNFRIVIEGNKLFLRYSKHYTLDSVEVTESGIIHDPKINVNINTEDKIDPGTDILIELNWKKWQMKRCIDLLKKASKKSSTIKMRLTLMEKIPRCLSCENTDPEELFIVE